MQRLYIQAPSSCRQRLDQWQIELTKLHRLDDSIAHNLDSRTSNLVEHTLPHSICSFNANLLQPRQSILFLTMKTSVRSPRLMRGTGVSLRSEAGRMSTSRTMFPAYFFWKVVSSSLRISTFLKAFKSPTNCPRKLSLYSSLLSLLQG